jgi:hypothetical protein
MAKEDEEFLGWLNKEARLLPVIPTIENYTKIPAWFQFIFYVCWLIKQCLTG